MFNNPHSRPDWLELFQSWWRGETPLGAVLFSVVMVALVSHIEAAAGKRCYLLCGALTLTFTSALEHIDWRLSRLVAEWVLSVGIVAYHCRWRVNRR